MNGHTDRSEPSGTPPRPLGWLVAFFFITFAVTWSAFAATVALSGRFGPAPGARGALSVVIFHLGVFAPSIVALALAARAGGAAGVRAFLREMFDKPVRARWVLFAVGFMVTVELGTAVLHRATTGAWPPFGSTPWYVMAVAMVVSTPVQAGEEIGWRGYALPRLAERIGLGGASIVLGVIWACWHLPLFFYPGGDTYRQSFPTYLLQVTAISVAMAWLYARSRGNVLLTMLMHAAINNTKDIVSSAAAGGGNPLAFGTSRIAWLGVALLWIAAAFFLARMRDAAASDGREGAIPAAPDRPARPPSSPRLAAGRPPVFLAGSS